MTKICIIGGCGHVGIPLGLAFAARGFDVILIDINKKAIDAVNSSRLPFVEEGAAEVLAAHIGKNLRATDDAREASGCNAVVFVTGTPVDEHHNPKTGDVLKVIQTYLPLLRREQLIILRSTIFPGTTALITAQVSEYFSHAGGGG